MNDRVKNLDSSLNSLQREFNRLQDVMRDLNPGLTDRNAVDRLARTLENVSREQSDLDRELRNHQIFEGTDPLHGAEAVSDAGRELLPEPLLQGQYLRRSAQLDDVDRVHALCEGDDRDRL